MIKRLITIKVIILVLAMIILACSSCQSSRAANYKAAKEKSMQDFHKGSQGKCNRYKH
jgi:PBP1b-binding outer membrane lipoprotein LpoB